MWASENTKTAQYTQITATTGIRNWSLQMLTAAEGNKRSAIGNKRRAIHVHNVAALQYRNDTYRGTTE